MTNSEYMDLYGEDPREIVHDDEVLAHQIFCLHNVTVYECNYCHREVCTDLDSPCPYCKQDKGYVEICCDCDKELREVAV